MTVPAPEDQKDTCHRSQNDAYPLYLSGQPGVPNLASNGFLACSGARIQAMFDRNQNNQPETKTSSGAIQGQLYGAAFAKPVGLVTLQVGGNDVNVAGLIKGCVSSSNGVPCKELTQQDENLLPGIDGRYNQKKRDTLSNVYLTARAQAPNARILVIGYPREFNPALSDNSQILGIDVPWTGRLHLNADDMTALNGLADQLDTVITANVDFANSQGARVEYVPESVSKFVGHEQDTADQAWWGINTPVIGNLNGDFHPNTFGQGLYRDAVLEYLQQHSTPPAAPSPASRQSGRITFVCPRQGAATFDLCAVNGDGNGPETIVTGTAPVSSGELSPDGSKVAYSTSTGSDAEPHIWVADSHPSPDGPHAIDLSVGDTPSWSSDGSRLVFTNPPGRGGISVINADGTGTRRQVSPTGDKASWSPDGKRIIFIDTAPLVSAYSVSADGGSPTMVVSGAKEAVFSPDGTRIAYISEHDLGTQMRYVSASVANTNGSEAKSLDDLNVQTSADSGDSSLSWAPDGTSILVQRDTLKDANLFISINTDGTGEHQVMAFTSRGNGFSPRWQAPSTSSPSISYTDLHTVDWANVTVPGEACGTNGPVQLHDRKAVADSSRWSGFPHVTVLGGLPIYGDLDGGEHDDAALLVNCDTGGGTGGSTLANNLVVYSGANGLHSIGVVTTLSAAVTSEPAAWFEPPILLTLHRLTAVEDYYGPNDPNACPSKAQTDVWSWDGSTFTPVTSSPTASSCVAPSLPSPTPSPSAPTQQPPPAGTSPG